jgi:hypothetical protein
MKFCVLWLFIATCSITVVSCSEDDEILVEEKQKVQQDNSKSITYHPLAYDLANDSHFEEMITAQNNLFVLSYLNTIDEYNANEMANLSDPDFDEYSDLETLTNFDTEQYEVYMSFMVESLDALVLNHSEIFQQDEETISQIFEDAQIIGGFTLSPIDINIVTHDVCDDIFDDQMRGVIARFHGRLYACGAVGGGAAWRNAGPIG